MFSEPLMIACVFNVLLLILAYVSGYRALMIATAIIWAIIGIFSYQEIEDKLVLSIIFLIAAGTAFLPVKGEMRK